MALTKVSSSLVSDNAITTGKLVDGGVHSADIATNAITSTKIAQNSILTKHIDDGQVTTAQLGADAVTAAKIADDAISEEHLDVTVITGLTEVTAATGDLLMVADISDSNNLKKIPVSSIQAGRLALTGGTITGTVVFNSAPTFNTAIAMGSTLNVASSIGIAGTTVIDSSRNLTNIGSIASSGNIVNDIGASGNDSFIEFKNSGYTGNVTSIRQNADSTRAEFNSTERSIHIQAGSGGSASSAEVKIYANQQLGLTIDSSKNATFGGSIGIGTTPETYHSDYKAIDINNSASVMGYSGNNGAWLMENLYYGTDNNWKHKNSDFSALVGMYDGVFNFYNTASGTADATATLQNRLKIDVNGNVGIGVIDPADLLEVNGGTAYPHIRITSSNNTSRYMRIGMEDAINHVIEASGSSTNLVFKTAGSTRLNIGSTGNVNFSGDITGVNDLSIADQILHTGDENTYMQFHQADGWRVVTGGSERLHIEGASVVFNHDGYDQDFRVESDSKTHMLFIEGDTNSIGFNTDDPLRPFDVRESLSIFGSGGTTELMLRSRAGTAQNLGAFHISIRGDVGGSNDDLKILRFTGGNSPSYAGICMQVQNSTGNVGIGTNMSTIDEKLHVVGQASFENAGNVNRGNLILGAHGSGSSKWATLAATHYNDATGSGNGTGAAGNMLIGGYSSETTNQVYIGGGPYELNPATHIRFYTHSATTHNLGGTEKLTIDSAGDIIIGSTSKIYSSGDTDSYLQFNQADTLRAVIGDSTRMIINTGETVFNDDSGNFDFRVESDDSDKMLFVDAGQNTVYLGTNGSDSSAHVSIQNPRDRHHISLGSGPNSSISATGQANYAEGVVSISNVSNGTKLSIPHTSQPNLWRPTYVELMFVSGEYNRTAGFGGYAKVSYSMLTYLANVVTVDVGGNVASVSTSGMNLEINFTSGYASGLSNHEGVQMHYRIMSRTPDYFQAWNATLN